MVCIKDEIRSRPGDERLLALSLRQHEAGVDPRRERGGVEFHEGVGAFERAAESTGAILTFRPFSLLYQPAPAYSPTPTPSRKLLRAATISTFPFPSFGSSSTN